MGSNPLVHSDDRHGIAFKGAREVEFGIVTLNPASSAADRRVGLANLRRGQFGAAQVVDCGSLKVRAVRIRRVSAEKTPYHMSVIGCSVSEWSHHKNPRRQPPLPTLTGPPLAPRHP